MPQLSDRTSNSPMFVELTQHYSSTSWRDSKCWENDQSIWKDVGEGSPKSSCTLSPLFRNDGNVDKVLYQNLVEMIPLVESLMDKNKAIARQASFVYTPTPSRDWQSKIKAAQSSAKGRKAPQLFCNNLGEVSDSYLPDDCEDAQPNCSRKYHPEEMQTLQLPSVVTKNFASKAEVHQLQRQLDHLEQKLQEKDTQLEVANSSLKHIDLLQMQSKVEELQKEVHDKEQQIKNAQAQLLENQSVIADLQSLVTKMESDKLESIKKVSETENELISLRCQVATHNFLFERMASVSSCDNGQDNYSDTDDMVAANGLSCKEQIDPPKVAEKEIENTEMLQRRYMAAIIVAKENPGEELLTLVAELRAELQELLMQTPSTFTRPTDHSIFT